MNKILVLFISFIFALSLNAKNISEKQCSELGEDYVFAGGECIQTFTSEGYEDGSLIVVVHGTWDEGTNTLGRYGPFTETLSMITDVTTVAVALPGYSGSSTNKFKVLAHEGVKNQAAREDYIRFVGELIKALKEKYEAETITYVGHSAGARMGATLTALEPGLIQNIVLAGGRYETKEENKGKGFISFADVMDKADKDTNYVFVYGTKDKISEPIVTTAFYEKVKDKINAKLVKVEGAAHIDLDMTDPSIDAISELVE